MFNKEINDMTMCQILMTICHYIFEWYVTECCSCSPHINFSPVTDSFLNCIMLSKI